MNQGDVTHVTRNNDEVKLLLDLVGWAFMVYYLTHPDLPEKAGELARNYWRKLVHNISVWTARQDIRSLPETEDDE